MPSTKTHYPQVPVEVAQKIADEQNAQPTEKTPEQLSKPATKEPAGTSSAQAKAEGEKGEVL